MAAAPAKLAARKTLIEHCWGALKWLLPGGLLVRSKIRVGAEVSLAHFGCNQKRALVVVGLEKLIKALKGLQPSGPSVPPDSFSLISTVDSLVASAKRVFCFCPKTFLGTIHFENLRCVFRTGSEGRAPKIKISTSPEKL